MSLCTLRRLQCDYRRAGACALALVLLAAPLFSGCDALQTTETRLRKANASLAARDYATAAIQFKSILQRSPDNVDARLGLAQSALELADPLTAERELTRATQLGAGAEHVETLRWRTALALGRAGEVAAALERPRAGLGERERQELRAQALATVGRLGEAQVIYEQVLAQPDAPSSAAVGLARVVAAQGQGRAALATLDQLLAREPNNAAALLAKGEIQLRAGHFDDAAALFAHARQALGAGRDLQTLVRVAAGTAETSLARHDLATARAALADLNTVAPQSYLSVFFRARLALAEHHADAAAEIADMLLNGQPNDVAALTLKGAANAELNLLAQAETSVARALRLQPDNTMIRKMLADLQLREGRFAAAHATVDGGSAYSLDADSLVLAGRASLAAGDTEAAIREFTRALTFEPGNATAMLELAGAYLAAGRSSDAVAILDQLPELPNGTYRAELLRLFALPAEKRGEEVSRLIRTRDSDPAAHTFAGLYYLSVRDIAAARAQFEAALKINPTDASALLSLGRLEFAAGRLVAAEAALQKLLTGDPKSAAIRVGLAEVAAKRGDAATVKRLLEEARALNVRDLRSRVLLSRVYATAGQFDTARQVIQEAMSIDGKRMDVLAAGAYVEQRAGGIGLAQQYLDRATRSTPDAPDAWFLKGRLQVDSGQLSDARASFERAVALRSDWTAASMQLGVVLLRSGDTDGALRLAANLKRQPASRLEGDVLTADVDFAQGRFAAAADGYGRVLGLRPATEILLRRYEAQRQGHLAGGTAALKEWLDRYPQDGRARFAYAAALDAANDKAGAISQYEQGLSELPENATGLNNLAWLYYGAHDSRATATARRAFALAPNSADIADTLGWILVGEGQMAEALGLLRQATDGATATRDARYHLAYALARSGQVSDSKRLLESLLATNAAFDSRAEAEGLWRELN